MKQMPKDWMRDQIIDLHVPEQWRQLLHQNCIHQGAKAEMDEFASLD
jgi:hypothetical protein